MLDAPSAVFRAWEAGADNPESVIGRLARQLYNVVEVSVLERGLGQIVSNLVAGATTIYNAIELGMMERLIDQLAGSLTAGASRLYHSAEHKGFDGLLLAIADVSLKSGRRLRRWHVGRLRVNLLWVVLALILTVVTFVIVWGS